MELPESKSSLVTKMKVSSLHHSSCQVENVASYLDGELDHVALADFEAHVGECPRCAAELRTQRMLLCTLDSAFADSRSFALPKNFSSIVAAHAQSDVSRMRHKSERHHAFRLCAVLGLAAFALLGAASGALVFEPARTFLRTIGNILSLVWQTAYDAGTSVALIARVVGRGLIPDSYGLGLLILLTFAILVFLLSRLIANYHRAEIFE